MRLEWLRTEFCRADKRLSKNRSRRVPSNWVHRKRSVSLADIPRPCWRSGRSERASWAPWAGTHPHFCSSESLWEVTVRVVALCSVVAALLQAGGLAENLDIERDATGESCIVSVRYGEESGLSGRIWDHILNEQYYLLDSQGGYFLASQWYTRGEGVAAFEYGQSCDEAMDSVTGALRHFADSTSDPGMSRALLRAIGTRRAITREEYERSDRNVGSTDH